MTTPKKHAEQATILTVSVALGALLSVCGGCYERVISARGPGADQVQTAEPYQEGGSTWENWIMGPPNDPRKRNGSRLNR